MEARLRLDLFVVQINDIFRIVLDLHFDLWILHQSRFEKDLHVPEVVHVVNHVHFFLESLLAAVEDFQKFVVVLSEARNASTAPKLI